MKSKTHSSQQSRLRIRLFHFTEREEVRMIRAVEESKLFMQSYGKGRQPMDIDYSHYENSNPKPKCPTTSNHTESQPCAAPIPA